MDLISKLTGKEIKELFSKNWLTHDAFWYGSCVSELGATLANKLNKNAVRMMAGVEMARILKLMGKPKGLQITEFAELKEVIETAFGVVQTDFMKFEFAFPEVNLLRGTHYSCFAHEGVKKFDLIDGYECGIIERIKGWLDCVNVPFVVSPEFSGCLMHEEGHCVIDFRFSLT